MKLMETSTQYLMVPVSGPVDDLTTYAAYIAIVDEDAGEPADSDYRAATWINGEAALLVNAGDYPAGQYMVYVRVVAAPEDVRMASGRLRVGDART